MLRQASRGQAIVLIVLSLVALLAFVGLAVDGGSLFFAQRAARNASDAGVLAGSYKLYEFQNASIAARNNVVRAAALAAAASNGFDSPQVTVQIENEITGEPQIADKTGYIKVIVHTEAPTYFIHLVYSGPVEVTVDSIGRFLPERPVGPPNMGIISLSRDACRAFENNGTGVFESNAGIWVNSDRVFGPCHASYLSGTSSTTLCEPGLNSVGSAYYSPADSGGGYYTDAAEGCPAGGDNVPNIGIDPIDDPLADIPAPLAACAGTPVSVSHNDSSTIYLNPGHYSSITATKGTVVLRPGIYCINSSQDNQGLKSLGGQFIGDGVVIFLRRGSFTLGSNVINELRAPTTDTCYDNTFGTGTCDWRGMLLYSFQGVPYGGQIENPPDQLRANGQAGSDNIDITFTGGGGSNFTGTVYAPFNHCKIVGSSGTVGFNSQFICETVGIAGSANFVLTYNPSLLYTLPPALSYIK